MDWEVRKAGSVWFPEFRIPDPDFADSAFSSGWS